MSLHYLLLLLSVIRKKLSRFVPASRSDQLKFPSFDPFRRLTLSLLPSGVHRSPPQTQQQQLASYSNGCCSSGRRWDEKQRRKIQPTQTSLTNKLLTLTQGDDDDERNQLGKEEKEEEEEEREKNPTLRNDLYPFWLATFRLNSWGYWPASTHASNTTHGGNNLESSRVSWIL